MKLRPTTQLTYKGVIKNHIKPTIGRKNIQNIRYSDCEALHVNLKNKKSADTADFTLNLLSEIFDYAVEDDKIPRNPVIRKNRKPMPRFKEKSPKQPFMNEEEFVFWINDKNRLEGEWKVQVALGGLAGARLGEVCAFQWPDINFEMNTITFNRKICHVTKKPADTKSHTGLGEPLRMLEGLSKILKEWKKDPRSGEVWLFPGKNGKYMSYNKIRSHWGHYFRKSHAKDFTGQAKGFHFHSLKHTHTQILEDRGYTDTEINFLTRHTKRETTLKYLDVHNKDLEKKMKSTNLGII
ncbi:hypothetical protein ES705_41490 [subsurface metagenome]